MSIVLDHGYIVTVNVQRDVFTDGWVAIDGDRIVGVGPMTTRPMFEGAETIDLRGALVTPGLINGHNHHVGSLFKSSSELLLLEPWLDQVALPLMAQYTKEDYRAAAYLGAIEQLHNGTTCSINHLTNVNDESTLESIIEPVVEVGVRQLVAKELRNPPKKPFSPRYPTYAHIRSLGEEIAFAEQMIDQWDGMGGLIHMGLAIETGANWLLHNAMSDEVILDGVALAKRRNLKITNHCSAGTPWLSIKEFQDLTGGGDVDYLVRIGALTDNWVLIHCLWLTGREIDHVARAGSSIVTNPVSNAFSCDGIAPLRAIFAAGINVGLGSDGAYVNGSVDMVEQMKFAILLQNVTHLDPTFMTVERVVEMATINNARAFGLDHLIGSIEVGKKADIAAFDLSKPHATVGNRPIATLVFAAHGTDADTVIVDGIVRLRHGQLVGFDREDEVLVDARARADECIIRAGLGDRVYVPWRPAIQQSDRTPH